MTDEHMVVAANDARVSISAAAAHAMFAGAHAPHCMDDVDAVVVRALAAYYDQPSDRRQLGETNSNTLASIGAAACAYGLPEAREAACDAIHRCIAGKTPAELADWIGGTDDAY
jgi:hypothetical protein